MDSSHSTPPHKPDRFGPFFVLGCVRSGTTMLRDVLRLHPNLAAPEESHLYRWSDPFGTDGYTRGVTSNPVLKRHREIDGITEEEFAGMVQKASSRAELYQRYMKLFIERRKPGATRWFDKTPQNVYGAAMMAVAMPGSRFVHIVRHPVNVVASLRIGKVMKVDRLIGAINYWREATDIMATMKRAYPRRVHELRYEDFVRDMPGKLRELLDFLEEPYDAQWFKDVRIAESDHSSTGTLSAADVATVNRLTIAGRKRYDFEDAPLPTAQAAPAAPDAAPVALPKPIPAAAPKPAAAEATKAVAAAPHKRPKSTT